ncbi:hypothetical protein ACOMHN_030930 [Nucella lapillus]
MLLSGSPALLLACVMSILFWPLQQATTIIYRGCAYRAVVGKEQALWFCLADNMCAMFHCQDNNVFSQDDCGCVPPHHSRAKANLHNGKNGSGAGGGGGGMAMTTAASSTSSPSLLIKTSSLLPSAVVLSAGGSIVTSPIPPTFPSSSSKHVSDCRPEIHIDGLTATRMDRTGPGGGDSQRLNINPRGVKDMKNGSAYFDGYSSLEVPLYENADFDNGISVEFVVLEEGSLKLSQVLMTNCNPREGASLEVVLNVDLGVIVFRLLYRFRDAVNAVESVVEVAVPYTALVAKRVALVFDGRTLTGIVNGNQRSSSVRGNGDYVMARRGKPLVFGNTLCDVDDIFSFRGQIKQAGVQSADVDSLGSGS